MIELTEEGRKELQAGLKMLEDAEASILSAMKPMKLAMDGVVMCREILLDKRGLEVAGECEGCERLLLIGDKGHRCDDGPILCEACSPTWGDIEGSWLASKPETLDDFDRERREQFFESFGKHLEGGGSRSDTVAYVL